MAGPRKSQRVTASTHKPATSQVTLKSDKKSELEAINGEFMTTDEFNVLSTLTNCKKKWNAQQSKQCNELLAKFKARQELHSYIIDLSSTLADSDCDHAEVIDDLKTKLEDPKVHVWIFEGSEPNGDYILEKIKEAFTDALQSGEDSADSLQSAIQDFLKNNKAYKGRENNPVGSLIEIFEEALEATAPDELSDIGDDSDVEEDEDDDNENGRGDDDYGPFKDFDFFDPNP